MANDKSRKFKQNQIFFCMQPWFVEYSRPIVFGEDRLRGCLLYTSSHSIFTDDGSRWTAEKSGFAENIGLRLNSPGRNFNK